MTSDDSTTTEAAGSPAASSGFETGSKQHARRPKTAPNPKRQKEASKRLEELFADRSNAWVIHYSCESFYDRPNGASPRITSIAVRSLDSAQTHSFSIHQLAERLKVPFGEIEPRYDELERQMLDAYYQHVGGHRGMKYVHWNMRDINYGFAAIDHRAPRSCWPPKRSRPSSTTQASPSPRNATYRRRCESAGAWRWGNLEFKALAQAEPSWRFVGVDPAGPMLELARRIVGDDVGRVGPIGRYSTPQLAC